MFPPSSFKERLASHTRSTPWIAHCFPILHIGELCASVASNIRSGAAITLDLNIDLGIEGLELLYMSHSKNGPKERTVCVYLASKRYCDDKLSPSRTVLERAITQLNGLLLCICGQICRLILPL